MRQFWSLAEAADGGDLYILSAIESEEWFGDEATPQKMHDAMMSISGELRVWLDSPGGDAFAGQQIHEMLRAYSASGRGRTVAMVTLAASAASIIAMACDEIRISRAGCVMIHEPWSAVAGRADEHAATAKILEDLRDAQIDVYARRTGRSREEILALLQGPDGNGTWMVGEKAIEEGFADRLIDEEAAPAKMRVAACADLSANALKLAALRAQADKKPEDPDEPDEPDEPEEPDDPEDPDEDDPDDEPEKNNGKREAARAALLRTLLKSYLTVDDKEANNYDH